MTVQVRAADYQKAARALKDGDREIRLAYNRKIRKIAKPLGQKVLEEGAAQLPKHGGLSARVAGSRVSVSATQLRAVIALKSQDGYDLRAMDRGTVRHPTYGHKPWVGQEIEPHAFTDAFEAQAPAVRAQMLSAGDNALERIAQEGS